MKKASLMQSINKILGEYVLTIVAQPWIPTNSERISFAHLLGHPLTDNMKRFYESLPHDGTILVASIWPLYPILNRIRAYISLDGDL